ncbi:MAG TPA: VOC family protein [Nocardioidaceae bacterium]
MTLGWYTLVIDAADPHRLAAFWAEVLGWPTAYTVQDEVALEAPNDPDDRVPALLFVRDQGAKAQKNRLHLDLNPDDQAHEVQRLLDLGARRVDIGQRNANWVVLADPEGNEFCVLSPRTS